MLACEWFPLLKGYCVPTSFWIFPIHLAHCFYFLMVSLRAAQCFVCPKKRSKERAPRTPNALRLCTSFPAWPSPLKFAPFVDVCPGASWGSTYEEISFIKIVRWPESPRRSVGLCELPSDFLDFLILFHQEKRIKKNVIKIWVHSSLKGGG